MMTNYVLYLMLFGVAYSICPWQYNSDVNPGKPEFIHHDYYVQMSPKTRNNTYILQVSASDPDVNDTMLYSLELFAEHEYVTINETTGILSSDKEFSDLQIYWLNIIVIVRDRPSLNDFYCRTDKANVKIELIGVEESTSTLSNSTN
uniref:Cadherin domain-containing protein n=2 Tax=Arion vulgaris TaxID=1028688 RepID=A0A0B6ZKC4_9EUPU